MDQPNTQASKESFRACCYKHNSYHKHNSLPLGPIQPSSPSTKELHDLLLTLYYLFLRKGPKINEKRALGWPVLKTCCWLNKTNNVKMMKTKKRKKNRIVEIKRSRNS